LLTNDRILLLRPLRGLATAASLLVALTCVVSVADAWSDWQGYLLVEEYVTGSGVAYADLLDADEVASTVAILLVLASLAAAVVFLVWLWQARLNAERIAPEGHRLARGWTIGSWFCPIVNLWFPFRIVDDIARASRPEATGSADPPLRLWWAAWLGTWLASLWLRNELRQEAGVEMVRQTAVANTVTTVCHCFAGVFVIVVIRRITAWQALRA
jgi:hypothetical protein